MIAGTALVLAGAATGAAVAQASGGSARGAQPAAVRRAPAATVLDTTTESKFTPLSTACRVADTRKAGGVIPKSGSRAFYIGGSVGFASQGGAFTSGCKVPKTATAVMVTITTTDSVANGFYKAYPTGAAVPTVAFGNYTNVVNVSTSGIVTMNSSGLTTLANYNSTTQFTIDVYGFYVKPLSAYINADASINKGSRVTAASSLGTGDFEVDFDRDVSGCAYAANSFYYGYTVELEPRSGNVNGVFVYLSDYNGTASNTPFYLTVTC